MLLAAHNGDLLAEQKYRLSTTFVPRVTEYGPHQDRDFRADGKYDVVARDFDDLAAQLGC